MLLGSARFPDKTWEINLIFCYLVKESENDSSQMAITQLG